MMSAEQQRSGWLADLTAADPQAVRSLGERFAARYAVSHRRLPQAGLMLLTLRETVQQQPFHLGEVCVSTAAVCVRDADGRGGDGAASVLADDAELAVALAICDAVASHGLDGRDEIAALVDSGAARRGAQEELRSAVRAATRVSFSDLSEGQETEEAP
jgi:alpha-D-ribose 1-methylphosphonate 5-triphosphate synthase subunit PhnG